MTRHTIIENDYDDDDVMSDPETKFILGIDEIDTDVDDSDVLRPAGR